MATRPVFIPSNSDELLVESIEVEFDWSPGLAVSQKQKSISALHNQAERRGLSALLEVSSKSLSYHGSNYSAFNLKIEHGTVGYIPVECAFQGSKRFTNGGPYTDLLLANPKDAKRDERLKTSGLLEGFEFEGTFWDLVPQTAFYDFIYLQSLSNNQQLIKELMKYKGFTDIEFNPKKSINCQARSCALAVALEERGDLRYVLQNKNLFITYLSEHGYGKSKPSLGGQTSLRLG